MEETLQLKLLKTTPEDAPVEKDVPVENSIGGEMRQRMMMFYERTMRQHNIMKSAWNSNRPSAVFARQHAWAVIRWSTGYSYPEIAGVFGVNHTTIGLAVHRYDEYLNKEGAK